MSLRTHNYDHLGRKQPARLDYAMLIQGAARLVGHRTVREHIRRVPDRALADTGEDDQGNFALVNCPCGKKPVARPESTKCPGCDRWYVTAGNNPNVYVVYGDMQPPAIPNKEADDGCTADA